MAEHTPVDPDRVELTCDVLVGMATPDLQRLIRPEARPIGGLILSTHRLTRSGTAPGTTPVTEHQILASWRHLAQLAGQLQAWRDRLPVHVRDQFDSSARDHRALWNQVIPDV